MPTVDRCTSDLNYVRQHWIHNGESPRVGQIFCAQKDTAVAPYALDGLPNKVMAAEDRSARVPGDREGPIIRGEGSHRGTGKPRGFAAISVPRRLFLTRRRYDPRHVGRRVQPDAIRADA